MVEALQASLALVVRGNSPDCRHTQGPGLGMEIAGFLVSQVVRLRSMGASSTAVCYRRASLLTQW